MNGRTIGERFAAKYTVREDGCWQWTGAIGRDGYGHMLADGRLIGAHRLAYELFVGPIPSGEEVHHVCERAWCVNPDHLVAVARADHAVISWRTFVCKHGHERRRSPNGRWHCPTCQAAASRRYYRRRVQA